MAADERCILVRHHRVIDLQDNVALAQSGFLGRHTHVRFLYHHLLQPLVVAYQCTDSGILARQHGLQLLLLLLRIVLRVAIQRPQHGINTRRYHLVGVERVDIHQVEVLVQGIENLQILGNFQVMVLHILLGTRRLHAIVGRTLLGIRGTLLGIRRTILYLLRYAELRYAEAAKQAK